MDDKRDEASAARDRHDQSMTMVHAHGRVSSPTAPRMVARLYTCADRSLRVRLLECLLRPLSPLGLVAVAAGAFAGLLHSDGIKVAVDEAMRFSGEQIAELARFVEQVEPNALEQFAALSARNQVALTTFSAAAVVLLMRALRRSNTAQADAPVNATMKRLYVER
jgi:hypothetical protein